MKKICHLTSAHKRYDVRIFKKECRSLANNGYEVTLIVNDNNEDEIIDNVKIISTKFVPKSRIDRMLKSGNKLFEKAVQVDADIYHFHDPELLPVGNKLKRIGKCVIFDSHENYPMQIKERYYIPKILRKIISFIYYVYETYSAKKIDAVIFPCTFNGINPFEKRAKKTVFINNVPILEELFIKYDEKEVKKEKVICHIGGLTYNRGITHLIKAAYKANAKLILGGNFSPKEYFDDVIKMKEFLCVDYRGFVNRDMVVEIYKNSMIGMCTILNVGQYNKKDNFATKVYEYMSMGLPVIISDSKYVKEVLKEYHFGVTVDPENIDEITNAILYLLNNDDEAKKMGQEGRRAIKEYFNWDIEEKKLLDLYNSLSTYNEE